MRDVDVVVDLLDMLHSGLHRELDDASQELLGWQPDPEANSIAVTVWHFSRFLDFLAIVVLQNQAQAEQFWYTRGWKEKTGYDPAGKGNRGWGALTGYTVEEMREVPVMDCSDLLAYFDQGYEALKAFLLVLPEGGMEGNIAGLKADRTIYFWTKLILVDAIRHWGEIQALKAMWMRQQRPLEQA